jgi:formylglycine-generating enzyme required for sulfatase activity
MGTTPWAGEDGVLDDPDSPAVYVSWGDTQSFLTALNGYTGKSFRLPSEAQWEYACRAGTTTQFYWGNDPDRTAIGDYAWYDGNAMDVGQGYAHVVGQKLPNTFGLFDMSGNAWEWCQDYYHTSYTDAPTDGSVWESPASSYRVLRGGAFSESSCRTADRFGFPTPDNRHVLIGFRVVRLP